VEDEMATIEIKHRHTGAALFEHDVSDAHAAEWTPAAEQVTEAA